VSIRTYAVEKPSDLDELKQFTKSIVGELCWQSHLTYGDELILDIGEKTPSNSKPFPYEMYGAWWLGSRGTTWSIISKDKNVIGTSDDDIEKIRQIITTLENVTVTRFEPQYPNLGLIMEFSNSNVLLIDPDEEDRSYAEVAFWYLKTPYHYIEVGSGSKWSYETYDK